ncbi:hypothetical protein GR239_30745 [Rhizobium leguminosarum]|uniref:Uncharacterized protein n=1 Tax=Rhizobium ruizarguesonis TaxID=2081791 RepID=A0AAE5C631_9HYPH|nr:hypothetical protein [Rhizobium ruizarguesonis]NEH78730.1 hypothetical protein [Rhizobium ruizarguesonis]NEH88261.1 hypothetical protein [Rhizobium ruizarguesonis]NEI13387.1 hypothetical protein [Rhizobium ruizarguesonis]NEI52542.1 hypothetical protein [Rhizobium ruizarguesonis]
MLRSASAIISAEPWFGSARPLHNSLNRNQFKDKIMQKFKVLQRPLRV